MITINGPILMKSLGRWVGPSLRIWRYWHRHETGKIRAVGEEETRTYVSDPLVSGRNKYFQFTHTAANDERAQRNKNWEAALVSFASNDTATLLSSVDKNEMVEHRPCLDIIDRLDS